MTTDLTFRALVNTFREQRPQDDPPHTMAYVASQCGISRQHLYHLMNGKQHASNAVELRIAKAFRVPLRKVCAALANSRKQ